MEHNSCHITDLNLQGNTMKTEGAILLTSSLASNALSRLTRLSLSAYNTFGDDGFIALVSALEQNTSLLHLDLHCYGFSERAFLALAESLPEIKELQRVDFTWYAPLASGMPLLLAGLHKLVSFSRCWLCTVFIPTIN
jgi:hypothetical protein